MDLTPYIREIPDFPKQGILFRDITPLLQSPKVFDYVISELSSLAKENSVEAVVGIESRGFIFGAPLARELRVPFVPVRKPGKLPAERMSIEYSLEYGQSQLDIHKDALKKGQKSLIVDDLLATGGTARAAAKLVELVGGIVSIMLFVVELKGLGGRSKISDYQVHSLLSYP